MSWTIERRGRVAVVAMNTDKAKAQNRAFSAGPHEAFDRLEAEHPDSPVVLTGDEERLSAGRVPVTDLLERAIGAAALTPEECLEQDALTRRASQAGVLRDVPDLADPLDVDLPDGRTGTEARHAHRRYWESLQGFPATW